MAPIDDNRKKPRTRPPRIPTIRLTEEEILADLRYPARPAPDRPVRRAVR